MYRRNTLARWLTRRYHFVVAMAPLAAITIYQHAGILWSKPWKSAGTNPGKRWFKGNRYE